MYSISDNPEMDEYSVRAIYYLFLIYKAGHFKINTIDYKIAIYNQLDLTAVRMIEPVLIDFIIKYGKRSLFKIDDGI